jgi:hypothetical protein
MIVPAETKVMVRMRLRGPGGSRVISLSGINRQMIATAATDPAIRRIKMTFCFMIWRTDATSTFWILMYFWIP